MEDLLKWTPLAQVITTTVFTIVGACVAAASLHVAYRNNFGWPPIALISSIGLKGVGGEHKEFTAVIGFEVWNRRKYPVSIRYMVLSVTNLNIRFVGANATDAVWHVDKTGASHFTSHALGPSDHEVHEVEIPFATKSLDALNAPLQLRITYFDPRSNRMDTVTVDHLYRLMPEKREIFA